MSLYYESLVGHVSGEEYYECVMLKALTKVFIVVRS